jgi:hypothetical protein
VIARADGRGTEHDGEDIRPAPALRFGNATRAVDIGTLPHPIRIVVEQPNAKIVDRQSLLSNAFKQNVLRAFP